MPHLITALNLTHSSALRVSPDVAKMRKTKAQANTPDTLSLKGVFSQELLSHGQGFESIGEYDNAIMAPPSGSPGYTNYNVNMLVIKSQGSLDHTLPNELCHLEPLIYDILHHAIASEIDLERSLAFLSVHSDVVTGAYIESHAAAGWHVAATPSRRTIIDTMLRDDIASSTLLLVEKIKRDAIYQTYRISDIAGTRIQSAPAVMPMEVSNTGSAYHVDAPGFAWRQAKAYEILHGNSYSFHGPIQLKPESIGQRHTTVALTYVPTI